MKRFSIIAMFLVLLTACQEEIGFNKFQEGVPARMGLSISLSSSERVQTRGVMDYESEISELILIMYESSGRKMVVDLTGNLVAGAADGEYGGHRTYTTREQIETDINGEPILSGTYRVYAIANWSSPFCELGKDELIAMSEDELNSAVGTNSGFVYSLSGTQRFPMTGYTEGIEVKPYETEGETEITGIKLRRLTSRIEFKFVNGENVRFVPEHYQIFNIPSGAYLMDNRTNSNTAANKYSGEYGSSEVLDIVSGGEIAFFMQENVQGPAANVNAYADRDKWDGTRGDGTKDFINAPENATYIVVTGGYEDGTHTGNVSYTIHLGKFGKSGDQSRAYNNFEVCRNEYHTYTITVNGVDSILAEAEQEQEDGGNVPGAEGTLTLTNKGSQFVIDAHYETLLLSFSLTALCANPNMIVQTPYSPELTQYSLADETALAGVDCNWVHFIKPESVNSLPQYPTTEEQNAGALTGIAGLATELQQAWEQYRSGETPSGDHILISGSDSDGNPKVYVVAYVDEYFYETDPMGNMANWTDFVNRDNRTLILNPAKSTSADENSIVYPDYIFQISQRSIKTTYGTSSSSINAFGVETWDETGRLPWGEPSSEYGLNDEDGYQNTSILLGVGQNNNWLSTSVLEKAGYVNSISDNSKESHVYYGAGETGLSGIYGFNACLTRNRDENGNGRIDDGELKWYLPSVDNFQIMWQGIDYLREDTQLFDPSLMSSLNNSNISNYNLFLSSNSEHRIYWPVEGASYGRNLDSGARGVRCVRNLSDLDGKIAPVSVANDNIITVLSATPSALRTTFMTGGEYRAGHTERDTDNRLPLAFEVAESNLLISDNDLVVNTVELQLEDLGPVKFGVVSASATFSGSYLSGNITFADIEEGYSYSLKGGSPINSNYLQFGQNAGDPWITLTISKDGVDDNIALYFNFSYWGEFTNDITVYKMLDNEDNEYGQKNNWGKTDTVLATLTVSDDVTSQGTFSKTALYSNTTGFCSSHYSQEADKSDLGQWRVPNQRELILMIQHGFLDDANSGSNFYASRTFFSRMDLGRYEGSTFIAKDAPFCYFGNLTLEGDNFVIRCVRDATPSSEAEIIDSSYSNSGGSLF